MPAARHEDMRPIHVLLSTSLSLLALACGGDAFTAGSGGPGGDPTSDSAPVTVDSGAMAPPEASSPPPDTGPAAAPDSGIVPLVTPDAKPTDVSPDAEAPKLCCVGTAGSIDNVHCGVGATAPCGTEDAGTTYNSASCSAPAIGASCIAWPQSYGSGAACASSEPCCTGTVQVCP